MFGCVFDFLLFEKNGKNFIKFCVTNEIKWAKTFQMLTVDFVESTMTKTQVQLWYNRFKESQENIDDDAWPKYVNNRWKY